MVVTPETAGIDPNLMRQRAQGAGAQSQIAQLLRGPQMQQAMSMQNQQMAPLQRGQQANIFSALANLGTRRKGQNDARQIQEQIAALRGQSEQGNIAEMQMKDAQQMRAFKQNEMMAQQARDDRANDFRGEMEVWKDKDGNEVTVGMTANGPVDSQGNPMILDGFRRTDKLSTKGYGRYQFPSAVGKDVADSFAKIDAAQNIKKIAKGFSQSDVDTMNSPLLSAAIKAGTPAAWENYVNNNKRNWSPRVTKLMNAMSTVGADQRHALFGAALTNKEGALSENIIVGANGLDFGDAMLRVDNLVDAEKSKLRGVDGSFGSDTLDNEIVKAYEYYQSPEELAQNKESAGTFDYSTLPPDIRAKALEYKEITGKDYDFGGMAVAEEVVEEDEPVTARTVDRREQRAINRANQEARNTQQAWLDELEAAEAKDRRALKQTMRKRGPSR